MSDLQWLATVIAIANHCFVTGGNGAIIAPRIEALLLLMVSMHHCCRRLLRPRMQQCAIHLRHSRPDDLTRSPACLQSRAILQSCLTGELQYCSSRGRRQPITGRFLQSNCVQR
ncbi:protein of unknown function [Burkholderia multivorans]